MLLIAKQKTWGPRWPQFNPQTHKITGWTHGRWVPGAEPVEWPGEIAQAPDTLVATTPEDQAVLDEARSKKRAEAARRHREAIKDSLRDEIRAELEVDAREKIKAQLRGDVVSDMKAKEVAEPVAAAPEPKRKPGRPRKPKPVTEQPTPES